MRLDIYSCDLSGFSAHPPQIILVGNYTYVRPVSDPLRNTWCMFD